MVFGILGFLARKVDFPIRPSYWASSSATDWNVFPADRCARLRYIISRPVALAIVARGNGNGGGVQPRETKIKAPVADLRSRVKFSKIQNPSGGQSSRGPLFKFSDGTLLPVTSCRRNRAERILGCRPPTIREAIASSSDSASSIVAAMGVRRPSSQPHRESQTRTHVAGELGNTQALRARMVVGR